MDENGESKLAGIRQIVRLKELLQKWQSVTLSKPEENEAEAEAEPEPEDPTGAQRSSGIPPSVSRRLTELISCDSDEEGCLTPEPPPDVPRGYLAVYVGSELRRFIIPTSYLSHSLFKVLLEKAEEEYGFDHGGGLTIPCEIETFKYLLKCMENHHNRHHQHQLQLNDNGNTCA